MRNHGKGGGVIVTVRLDTRDAGRGLTDGE
jgi:hypothetical protein